MSKRTIKIFIEGNREYEIEVPNDVKISLSDQNKVLKIEGFGGFTHVLAWYDKTCEPKKVDQTNWVR